MTEPLITYTGKIWSYGTKKEPQLVMTIPNVIRQIHSLQPGDVLTVNATKVGFTQPKTHQKKENTTTKEEKKAYGLD